MKKGKNNSYISFYYISYTFYKKPFIIYLYLLLNYRASKGTNIRRIWLSLKSIAVVIRNVSQISWLLVWARDYVYRSVFGGHYIITAYPCYIYPSLHRTTNNYLPNIYTDSSEKLLWSNPRPSVWQSAGLIISLLN